ncbi:MAG: hypothetical protein RQ763_03980 [Sulfurimonas sp.]|uniref:hypothetical protein n=1 Tax=Sulfurimonas sp. TaxID=2022749 RepID=UPI0028CE6E04|nr:hypothetical protein [Sulfurimonas sp.]MDT8338340.1 hypothetical protein [Sulfurimonas sp.]
MGYSNIRQVLGAIAVIFLVLILWVYTYKLGCFSLLMPIIVTVVIASGYIEIRMKQKECFRDCYFKKNTLISKILTSPVLPSIFFILLSISYSLSLMYLSINFDSVFYLLLTLFIAAVFGIYRFFLNFFANIVNDKHLEIFARETTVKISALILFCGYAYLFLNSSEPEYLRETLKETLTAATNSISSNCSFVDVVLRTQTEVDSRIWFLMKESNSAIEEQSSKNILWISFMILNSLAILGLNRFIVQVIYLLNKIIKRNDGR